MTTRAHSFGHRLRHGRIRTSPPLGESQQRPADPPDSEDHGLAKLGRDAGLRTPDAVATPEMAAQTGMSIGVLRWVPLYVIGLAVVLVACIGLVVLVTL